VIADASYWTRDFKRIHARWMSGPDEVSVFTRTDGTLDRLLAKWRDIWEQ
jgi:hypothetical protein